jgi:hypothetical protein
MLSVTVKGSVSVNGLLRRRPSAAQSIIAFAQSLLG